MEDENLPSTIVGTANADHYRWGGSDQQESHGWYLVRTADLHVIEERMPPSAKETRHVHTYARQFFYVLEGELTIEIEHHHFTLRRGEGIEVAPRQAHQAINHSAADLRLLVISQPPSHGDRIDSPT